MSGLPHQPSTYSVARESLQIGERTGDRTFKIIGLVMMAATGLGTLLHSIRTFMRDIRDDRRRTSADHHATEPIENPDFAAHRSSRGLPDRDDDADLTWGRKAARSGRAPHQSHAQAVHHEHDAVRQR